MRIFIVVICVSWFSIAFSSCLSEQEKRIRQEQEVAEQIAEKQRDEQRIREIAREKATQDSLDVVRYEQERKEKELYNKYLNNRLQTGATPYAYLYGYNKRCNEWGCSEIKVTTPNSSEVLVLIKNNNNVVKHAYIRASNSYTFEVPNGTYQPFFYYGKGWNPSKIMKQTDKGVLKGGFISNEHFSKDDPQTLNNNILEYELILQQSGNFSTKASSKEEAF